MRQAGAWCVLLTKAGRTLALAHSLGLDGYEVWTPVTRVALRRVRWTITKNVRVPLMAGFVFARQPHLFDLLELERMPVKPRRGKGLKEPAHAKFTVLRDLDGQGIALVADRHLDPLREAEKPAKVRRQESAFTHGAMVRVTTGSYEGHSAVVERSDRRNADVWISFFGRHHKMKIPTSILRLDEAYRFQSETDTAAKIAA